MGLAIELDWINITGLRPRNAWRYHWILLAGAALPSYPLRILLRWKLLEGNWECLTGGRESITKTDRDVLTRMNKKYALSVL